MTYDMCYMALLNSEKALSLSVVQSCPSFLRLIKKTEPFRTLTFHPPSRVHLLSTPQVAFKETSS